MDLRGHQVDIQIKGQVIIIINHREEPQKKHTPKNQEH